MTLLAAAQAAYEARGKELTGAALDALKAVLGTNPDGTPYTLEQAGLTRVAADVDPMRRTGIVVWSTSDGVNVAAQLERDQTEWRIRLVEQDSDKWAAVSDLRITNLAELYAAYLAAG